MRILASLFGNINFQNLDSRAAFGHTEVEIAGFRFKFGISGCPFSCAEGLVRDIGITGSKKGWSVSFGGNAGANARVADILAKDLTKEDALDLVRKLLTYYKENAKKKERTAKFVTRVGIDAVKAAVLGE